MSQNSKSWRNYYWFVENTIEFPKCLSVVYGLMSVDDLFFILSDISPI